MYVDINSCFASIEQQENPLLRRKPLVVAAYVTPNGCVLASSREAKVLGIKTGMRVKDAEKICPNISVLPCDPPKYRKVHAKLEKLLSDFSLKVVSKSIDEFVFKVALGNPWENALHVKRRIKQEIGEWITVSIGISTNRYLAKIASNLQKPDGLVEINRDNYLNVYSKLKLTDLTGIKLRNEARLGSAGIYTVLDFYNSPLQKLKFAFGGVGGFYWQKRLHGYEIDDFPSQRKSIGNSYAFPNSNIPPIPILAKLIEKTGFRLRSLGYKARGVSFMISYQNYKFWHKSLSLERLIFDSRDIFKYVCKLFSACPIKDSPIREIAVSVFNLTKNDSLQLEMFADIEKNLKLVKSIDKLNSRWGNFTVSHANMADTGKYVHDRIGFGSVN